MSCDVGKATEALLILQHFRQFTYVTTHYPTLPSLYLRNSSFSNPSVASPTSQFILQPFFCFSYVTSSSLNSPGEPPVGSMHTCPAVGPGSSPVRTSFLGEVFLGFFLTCKTNVRKLQAPKVPEYHLAIMIIINHHSLWAPMTNPSVASPTSQFILQPFFCFSYVTSSSLNSPGQLCSFSNLSVTSPTSKLNLQPFRRFTYITAHSPTLLLLHLRHSLSPTLLSLLLRHRLFTYVTW